MSKFKYSTTPLSLKSKTNYINNRLSSCKFNKNPTALFMIGSTGSGKSTIISRLANNLKISVNSACVLNPDIIFGDLFNYNESYFKKTHKINLELLKGAYTKRANIIYDKTGKNFNKTFDIIKKLNKIGYKVFIAISLVTLPVALKRVTEREHKSPRKVPLSKIKLIYNELDKSIPKYINLNCEHISGTFIYDNSNKLVLIYKQICKPEYSIKWFNDSNTLELSNTLLCKKYINCTNKCKSKKKTVIISSNKIHTGPRGGKYILKDGKKIYITH